MSNSRALRATATVAGVAALGATFAGTAAADSNGVFDSTQNNSYDPHGSDSYGLSDFGSDDTSGFDNGLLNFQMPSLGTNTRGVRTDGHDLGDGNGLDDGLDNSSDSGSDRRHHKSGKDDACGFSSDSDDNDSGGPIQDPVQCRNNSYGNTNLLGQNLGMDNVGKLNSRGVRTDDSGLGGVGALGGSGSDSSDLGNNSSDRGSSDGPTSTSGLLGGTNETDNSGRSSTRDDGKPSYGTDGNGLSGHRVNLPIG